MTFPSRGDNRCRASDRADAFPISASWVVGKAARATVAPSTVARCGFWRGEAVNALSLLPVNKLEAAAELVDDAALHGGIWDYCFQGRSKPSRPSMLPMRMPLETAIHEFDDDAQPRARAFLSDDHMPRTLATNLALAELEEMLLDPTHG